VNLPAKPRRAPYLAPPAAPPFENRNLNVITSSDRTDWCTPASILERVRTVFGGAIGLDPCSHPADLVQADHVYQLPEEARALMHTIAAAKKAKDSAAMKEYQKILDEKLQGAWREQNGLLQPWRGFGGVFVNPPFSNETPKWARKIRDEFAQEGQDSNDELIALLPARVDANWFQELVIPHAAALVFWKGRLTFEGAKNQAPFPTVFAYYGEDDRRFYAVFGPKGWAPYRR
jgi:hypothetical protein